MLIEADRNCLSRSQYYIGTGSITASKYGQMRQHLHAGSGRFYIDEMTSCRYGPSAIVICDGQRHYEHRLRDSDISIHLLARNDLRRVIRRLLGWHGDDGQNNRCTCLP